VDKGFQKGEKRDSINKTAYNKDQRGGGSLSGEEGHRGKKTRRVKKERDPLPAYADYEEGD